MRVDQLIERVAKAIEGPHLPVPDSSRYTLDELRDVRWRALSRQDQSIRLNEARAAIAAMPGKG